MYNRNCLFLPRAVKSVTFSFSYRLFEIHSHLIKNSFLYTIHWNYRNLESCKISIISKHKYCLFPSLKGGIYLILIFTQFVRVLSRKLVVSRGTPSSRGNLSTKWNAVLAGATRVRRILSLVYRLITFLRQILRSRTKNSPFRRWDGRGKRNKKEETCPR